MNERIKALRKILSLSQAEFARRINVNASTVCGWEHDVKVPDAKVNEICKTFGVNKDWLLTGKGKPDTPNDKELFKETISDRLRFLRKKLGLTQKELASRIGVTDVAISIWERDARGIQPAKKQLLCRTFGINLDWFETGEGDIFSQPDAPSNTCETARELAVKNGCDEITALVFERFMELPEADKKAFGLLLSKLISQKVLEAAVQKNDTNSSGDVPNIYRDVYTINNTTFNQKNFNE